MSAVFNERHKARGLALQALYEIDATGHGPEEVLTRQLGLVPLSPDNFRFAEGLVRGVLHNRAVIDAYIRRFAHAWPIEQMAVVDRNVLRLAIFEVLVDNRVPVPVAINEAVELAREFGGQNSPRFINGVLSSVNKLTQDNKGG
jgi:N utilization substance protein B